MNDPIYNYPLNREQGLVSFVYSKRLNRNACAPGFTLLEILVVVAIIGTLSAIALPNYMRYRYEARTVVAITDIKMIEKQISFYVVDNNQLPNSLNDLPTIGTINDPWGNPYKYLRIDGGLPSAGGKARKDHFMVPVNTDYDLYSMGKDGKSQSPFTAKASQDDIVRANDGGYVGLVSNY